MSAAATHPGVRLLVEFGWKPEIERCLVISRGDQPSASGSLAENLTWLSNIAELSQPGRYPLALVVDHLPHISRQEATHLLAQLRDTLADRIIVLNEGDVLSSQELLALGFIRQDQVAWCDHVYLHDPAEFFAGRDWNNNQNWANPENFRKFRW